MTLTGKKSGIGREAGTHGIEEYLDVKFVSLLRGLLQSDS
jgi:acyl-CoA reductase-like NAD-dependent aldehyde dehydrogenase